jgi:hypothetical protein
MKKAFTILAMTATLFLLSMGINLAQQEPVIKFNRPEVESLLAMFNETPIKGQDLDVLAPLMTKVKNGAKEASAFTDTSQVVSMKVSPQEAGIFLNIINNATFPARFVDLVLSMKKKIQVVAPPMSASMPGMNAN